MDEDGWPYGIWKVKAAMRHGRGTDLCGTGGGQEEVRRFEPEGFFFFTMIAMQAASFSSASSDSVRTTERPRRRSA